MLNHRSPCLASASKRSGLEAAGCFPEQAATHPFPTTTSLSRLLECSRLKENGWDWVSPAITYHRELDFCPRTQGRSADLLRGAANKCGKRHLVGSSSCCRHPPSKNNSLERSRSNATIGLLRLKGSQECSAWIPSSISSSSKTESNKHASKPPVSERNKVMLSHHIRS